MRQILRLVQIESICTRLNKCYLKTEILLGMGRKHCEKRRKCRPPAFSPFPAIFSKCFFFRIVKGRDYVVRVNWSQKFVIVIVTGFIFLSLLLIVSTMVMWESNQWLWGDYSALSWLQEPKEKWIGALITAI